MTDGGTHFSQESESRRDTGFYFNSSDLRKHTHRANFDSLPESQRHIPVTSSQSLRGEMYLTKRQRVIL